MVGSRDLLEGVKGLEETEAAYLLRAAYYEGHIPERFATEQIRRLVENSGHGYRFRLAKIPVNVMGNRLRISSITSGSEAVDARIQEIREANDLEIQEAWIMNRTLVYGDAYAFVWPLDQDAPEESIDGEYIDVPADDDLQGAGVEIAYQSPLGCRAFYDAEDGRRVRFVIRRWQTVGPLGKHWRAEVWYPDRVEHWLSKPDAKGTDEQDWEPYGDIWPEPHGWGEIPIKHARTGLPYGTPEHADAMGPQDLVTKAVVTQGTDVETHGWPERYAIADDARVLETARDAVNWSDDTKAPAVSGPETVGRRRGPGVENWYTGTKSVGTFAPPDPGDLIEPIEQWVRMMSTVTETPLYEFDPRIGGDMSGRARDKADAPLRAKEKDRKTYLLRFWREVWGLALHMDGIADPGTIEINWSPPEVISDPEWWATAQVRQAMGVPPERILQEANYLPEDVDEWLDDQAERATLDQQIARLAALGDALQKVGAGAALLGIEAEAGPLISRILGEAGGKALPANWSPPEPEPVVDPNAPPKDPGTGDAPPPRGSQ